MSRPVTPNLYQSRRLTRNWLALAWDSTLQLSAYTAEYDPSSQITLALTIIAGGWITPTRPIDRRLQQAVEPINPVIAGTPDTTTPDNQDNLPK
jgi:hypothetical protein